MEWRWPKLDAFEGARAEVSWDPQTIRRSAGVVVAPLARAGSRRRPAPAVTRTAASRGW